MCDLKEQLREYEDFCRFQKELDEKTVKAYRIDLSQFHKFTDAYEDCFSKPALEAYCRMLHKNYKPRTAKRKLASIKAFCHWLEYEGMLESNPFSRVDTRFREPKILPRVMSTATVEDLFREAYRNLRAREAAGSGYRSAARDVAVLELLFATGARVSELTHLTWEDIDLEEGYVRIYGKGDKERIIQISNRDVLDALGRYQRMLAREIEAAGYFFINRRHQRYSEQSVRHMLDKYAKMAGAKEHVTPHMFRHTVATLLLEEDVDIRYIQQLLGHSSILTTQTYTHVARNKQKKIMTEKHPRNKIVV